MHIFFSGAAVLSARNVHRGDKTVDTRDANRPRVTRARQQRTAPPWTDGEIFRNCLFDGPKNSLSVYRLSFFLLLFSTLPVSRKSFSRVVTFWRFNFVFFVYFFFTFNNVAREQEPTFFFIASFSVSEYTLCLGGTRKKGREKKQRERLKKRKEGEWRKGEEGKRRKGEEKEWR